MALSKVLKNFVKDFFDAKPDSLEGLHISDRDGLLLLGRMARRMENDASLIQWTGTTEQGTNGDTANTIDDVGSAAAQLATDVELSLTDLNNKTYDDAAQDYTVDLTAADQQNTSNHEYSLDGGTTWVAFSGATEFTLADGKLTFKVRADYSTGNGDNWTLTMSNASSGKATDGTLTLTSSA